MLNETSRRYLFVGIDRDNRNLMGFFSLQGQDNANVRRFLHDLN
ncbi:MAG: hypothetical protein ACTS73_06675 [Arsenophonus sp. NEOnobi-MAG3]